MTQLAAWGTAQGNVRGMPWDFSGGVLFGVRNAQRNCLGRGIFRRQEIVNRKCLWCNRPWEVSVDFFWGEYLEETSGECPWELSGRTVN